MKLSVLAAPLLLASAALADVGVVESTGAFNSNGWFTPRLWLSAIGAPQNARLNGYDLGSVDALAGQTLLVETWFFENYAYNGGGTPSGALTNNNWLDGNNVASLLITIKSGSNTISSNSYTLYQNFVNGNNRGWQPATGGPVTDLAAGLSNGSYSVEFRTTYNANQWTGSFSTFNASTATSTASFTVIPVPGAAALVGLAGLIASRRRSA